MYVEWIVLSSMSRQNGYPYLWSLSTSNRGTRCHCLRKALACWSKCLLIHKCPLVSLQRAFYCVPVWQHVVISMFFLSLFDSILYAPNVRNHFLAIVTTRKRDSHTAKLTIINCSEICVLSAIKLSPEMVSAAISNKCNCFSYILRIAWIQLQHFSPKSVNSILVIWRYL